MLATPNEATLPNRSGTASEAVEVQYGTHRVAECLVGRAIGRVKTGVREHWGLPYFCDAVLNGRIVSVSVTLRAGDRLEFRRRFGFKGAENASYAEADLLIARSEELQAIATGEPCVEVAVRRAVQFCLARFGRPLPGDMPVLHEVLLRLTSSVEVTASAVERIADRLAPQPADVVDSVWVAERLACTTTWIADMARRGTIPAACVVPGTGNGKVWKFYRAKIEPWLTSR